MPTRLTGALCTFVFAAHAFAADPIVASDLLRLQTATSIDVARDGTRAVFVVRSIWTPPAASEPDLSVDEDRDATRPRSKAPQNVSHLYLLDIDAGASDVRQLTFGRRSDHSPRLSPDGENIVFVRAGTGDDVDDDAAQLWLLPVAGGEARQLTRLERGAGEPRWAPDGRTLLFVSSVRAQDLPGDPPWASERPRADVATDGDEEMVTAKPDGSRREIRRWLAENARRQDPVVIDRLDFQGEQALRKELAFDQLYRLAWQDPDATPEPLTQGFRDHGDAAFLPDGRFIVYSGARSAPRHPDRIIEASLWRLPVAGGEPTEFLAPEGWSVRSPAPGPDGSVIAFLGRRSDEPTYRPWQVGLVTMVGDRVSDPVWLTDESTFDHSVWQLAWLPVRSSLLFTAPVRGGVPLYTMELGLLEPAPLVAERSGWPVGVNTFGANAGTIVYAETSPDNPSTLRVRDARGDRLALDLNPWVADRELSRPEPGSVTTDDGLEVDYWIMPPTRRVAGRQYPLALEIHGGPSSMWGPGERTMWHEFQLLCSWGYGVVYANPRGSGGYGYAFKKANYQDWGAGPGGDVLAAVDVAALEEWVDPDRLVVTGGSYGGYLTAWIIAHDTRFKAAVAQRGVYDLETFFGEGNAWRLVPWDMGGYPWEPRIESILERESPFTVVNRIRTPLLIMHASEDLRTGVSQSEMLYRALKELERPVEYVRYPDAGHDLSRTGDPNQRLDRVSRIVEFFERFVENDRGAPRLGPGGLTAPPTAPPTPSTP